jgi:hypothetical protein
MFRGLIVVSSKLWGNGKKENRESKSELLGLMLCLLRLLYRLSSRVV